MRATEVSEITTIGHSNLTLDKFLALLKTNDVSAIADVRSVPLSKHAPQFNQRALIKSLKSVGIQYVFLGKELGARSRDPLCYVDGKVQYGRLARTPEFITGIKRLLDGASRERISVMCTEQDPLDCHRSILVAQALTSEDTNVVHLHNDGSVETHDEALNRLRRAYGLDQPSLFDTDEQLLAKALLLQEGKIAYVDQEIAVYS